MFLAIAVFSLISVDAHRGLTTCEHRDDPVVLRRNGASSSMSHWLVGWLVDLFVRLCHRIFWP